MSPGFADHFKNERLWFSNNSTKLVLRGFLWISLPVILKVRIRASLSKKLGTVMTSNYAQIQGPLIVGIIPQQHPEVLRQAAALAHQLKCPIIFAYVRPDSYLTEWDFTRDITQRSLHPDDLDDDNTTEALALLTSIETHMADSTIVWNLRILAGEPWRALDRLAADSAASMIIVGTRRPTVSSRLSMLVGESTGAHLAVYQHRPLLVVPPGTKREKR